MQTTVGVLHWRLNCLNNSAIIKAIFQNGDLINYSWLSPEKRKVQWLIDLSIFYIPGNPSYHQN